MLTQKQIDDILNDSRYADEGPTKLARRFEAAGVDAERERCIGIVMIELERNSVAEAIATEIREFYVPLSDTSAPLT